MKMDEPRRLLQHDQEKVIVGVFRQRERRRDPQRLDDLWHGVGVTNHEDVSGGGLQFRD